MEVPNRPGGLAGLLDRIATQNHNVSSVLTTGRDADTTSFALRVETIEGQRLAGKLRKLGYEVLWPPPKPAAP